MLVAHAARLQSVLLHCSFRSNLAYADLLWEKNIVRSLKNTAETVLHNMANENQGANVKHGGAANMMPASSGSFSSVIRACLVGDQTLPYQRSVML
jgi:hypothetical protein